MHIKKYKHIGKIIILIFILILCLFGCTRQNDVFSETKTKTEQSEIDCSENEEPETENSETEDPEMENPKKKESETEESETEKSETHDSETSKSEIDFRDPKNNISHDEKLQESIEIVMVGDILLHTPVTESGRMEDGTLNYDSLFIHTKDLIEEADIAIANQEVILGGEELGLSGYPCFNGPYEVADALSDNGFDIILHATNHALDKGETGIRNCIGYWKEHYPQMKVVGINESQEEQDENICMIEKNGIKVAVLNYTYGTNGIELPENATYLVNLLDKNQIKSDIERAKQEADYIIVCPHWGTEYHHEPDMNQKEWAKYFADLGVDLVIGTHPHVIEPVEWVNGTEGNKTLVYYSLGNYVNATSDFGSGIADRMLGAIAKVQVSKNGDGTVILDNYSAIPIVSHLQSGPGKITVYPLVEYNTELERMNEIVQQDPEFSKEYLEKIWNDVFQDR